MVSKRSKKKYLFFFTFLNWEKQKNDMVLGKKVAISIGNGAEIQPLEKGRKSPVHYHTSHHTFHDVA